MTEPRAAKITLQMFHGSTPEPLMTACSTPPTIAPPHATAMPRRGSSPRRSMNLIGHEADDQTQDDPTDDADEHVISVKVKATYCRRSPVLAFLIPSC